MRILQWAFPLLNSRGGREEFVIDLTRSLVEAGESVAMVHDHPEESPAATFPSIQDGVERFAVSFTHIERANGNPALRSTLASLEAFVEKFSPDVIHFHTPGGRDIPFLKAIAAVSTARVVYTEHESVGHRIEPARRSRALLDSFVDQVVCPSESSRRQLLALFPEWQSRTQVIPNGVGRVGESAPTASGMVFSSGRHSPEKGFGVLIAAWSIVQQFMPEARLVIGGSGGQTPTLTRMVSHYGLDDSIEFAGWLTREDNRRHAASAEVVVVPSIWSEPFGLVAVEAALAGTPLIASRTGALEEIVQHGVTGLHVEPGDVAGLAIAIVNLLRDKAYREELGTKAQKYAEASFGMDKCVQSYRALYDAIRRSGEVWPRGQ